MGMIHIRKILMVFFIISCVGFKSSNLFNLKNYKELKKENLLTAFIYNSSPSFKGYFYNGSKTEYLYFVSKWDVVKDKYFKISIHNFSVIKPFAFNSNTEQRVDLFKGNNEEFGGNKFYKLYIQK